MTHYECYTIVEGAMDAELTTANWPAANRWMANQIIARQDQELDAQAYFIAHAHPMNVECECIQFLTSHQPFLRTTRMRP